MSEKYNKNTIISEVARETGIPLTDVKKAVDLFIDKIKEALLDGRKVLIKGFVTMIAKEAKPRIINNLQPGEKKLFVGVRKLPKAYFSEHFANQVKNKQ